MKNLYFNLNGIVKITSYSGKVEMTIETQNADESKQVINCFNEYIINTKKNDGNKAIIGLINNLIIAFPVK